jgi:glycosyltransferase involved in cell wall biosynthesis
MLIFTNQLHILPPVTFEKYKNAMDRYRVTAFVPTFNRSVFLKEALSSLFRQTRRPDEIIVIDDGSTDDTAQVVASFGPQVTYVRKVNGGKSSALNLGLQHSSHELIYILDDDDIAADDAIERMAEALQNNPEYGFAYGGYNAFTVLNSGTVSTKARAPQPADDEELPIVLMHRCLIMQPSMLVRKSCYEHVGPFDEEFVRSQDYEMLLRLARRFKGKRLDGVVFHQRQHSGMRGTAAMPISAESRTTAWRDFNSKIFSSIYTSYSLNEYLSQPATTLSNEDRITALLQRCVIVGRQGLWNFASNDLRDACALASQVGIHDLTPRQSIILQRMFDPWSSSLHDLAAGGDFRSTLLGVSDPVISKQIRAALSQPLLDHIRDAVHNRAARTSLYLIACLLCLSPSGGMGINHLGNLVLKIINRARLYRVRETKIIRASPESA